jgi:hypothetical protein
MTCFFIARDIDHKELRLKHNHIIITHIILIPLNDKLQDRMRSTGDFIRLRGVNGPFF